MAESRKYAFDSPGGIFGVTVFFFFFVILSILTFDHLVIDAVVDEYNMTQSYLPESTVRKITTRANNWYTTIIVDSGFEAGTYALFLPNREQMRTARQMGKLGEKEFPWFEKKLDAFFYCIHQFLFRLSHLLAWYPFLLLLLIPSIIDGWMRRAIKKTNFDYTSPFFSHYSKTTIILLILGSWCALWVPLSLPPWLIPVSYGVIAMAAWILTGNIMKRF